MSTCSNCQRRRGFTLLELLVVLAIVSLLTGLLLAAVQRTRAAAARVRCADNLRQIALGLHGYHDGRGYFPPGMDSPDPKNLYPFLSWLGRILPYVEQPALWARTERAYQADRNFLTPAHDPRAEVITIFLCPADPRLVRPDGQDITGHAVAFTSYLGVEGRDATAADGLLYADSKHRLADIIDGSSNTLLVGERPPSSDLALGWWYAGWGQRRNGDAEFLLGTRTRCNNRYITRCPEGPYHFTPGRFDNPCDMFHFWSPHPGGAHFALADGSVHFLKYSADEIMPALATRAGGETVTIPD